MSDLMDFIESGAVPEVAPPAVGWVDDDIPPAGTACQSCRSLGHYCQAKCYRGESSTLCLACAHGVDCAVTIRLKPKLEALFIPELEPVRHDGPSSAVRDVTPVDPAKRIVAQTAEDVCRNSSGRAVGTGTAGVAHVVALEERSLIVRAQRERLRLAAPAPVPARAIEIEAEAEESESEPEIEVEEETKPMGFAVVDEAIKEAIRRAPASENNSDLGRRLNVHNGTVYYWRKQFKKQADRPKAKTTAPAIRGGASGTAIDIVGVAERIHAMAPNAIEAKPDEVTISVTFTDAGVNAWWAKLSLAEKVKVAVGNIVF